MIKYLRLRKRFDARKMEEEMRRLEAVRWKAHHNQAHYSGEWTVLPLRSMGGSQDNILSLHAPAKGAGAYRDTELLENFLDVQSVTGYKGGNLPRVHLVMDCLVNDWLREIFDRQVDTAKQVGPAADGRI